ncbi:ATP-binding protein [Streptomyces sp. MST-110588]|uniref:ATP-binding protein n=1 Tax=Streptomyces sp. MST-110588 TaxID=2833628 RepID=UPI001F5CEABA|nr:ATP-binding protein [Streptomyces sp. MST-110588]UNO39827.1 ATP-binding protein [Streptomyces sp. MST-110588]
MITEVSRQYTLGAEAYPFRIAQVRRIVAAHLRHWGLEPLMQPVGLGVSELLTNVYRHAKNDKACVLELRWTGRRLTASVADKDRSLPRMCSPVPLATHGRGLAMIASLSDSWGTHATPDGKVVWFTVRTDAPTGPPLRPKTPLPAVPTAEQVLLPTG